MHILFRDAYGSGEIVRLSPRSFLYIARGTLSRDNIATLLAVLPVMGLVEPYTGFFDYDGLEAHTPEAQACAEAWGATHQAEVTTFHLLASAPLVMMGTHMINQVFKKLFTYHSREEFYDVLTKEQAKT